MNRLQEHLVENQQLNNTLQLELSVYDKMHDDNKVKSKLYSCMKFQQLYLSLKESGDLKMNAEFAKKKQLSSQRKLRDMKNVSALSFCKIVLNVKLQRCYTAH